MPDRKKAASQGKERPDDRSPYRVRLPGFVSDEQEIGLGDAIARATYRIGIRPCAGCGRRAAALNRWVVFKR